MSDDAVLFNTINYQLKKLLIDIDMGEIGLPDLQRPFVWKSVAVRDLLDSMYKGFPVGHILLWKNESDEAAQIGVETKPKKQDSVIVDGQQRLASLYSVLWGKSLINKKFEEMRIKIAFKPKEQKFAVPNAAIQKDPQWLPDISILWKHGAFNVINKFIDDLKEHQITESERDGIATNINRLHRLEEYRFTAYELNSKVDPETVADIFGRLNSKGTKLNQTDYILTLMSVFWSEGRKDLRKFARQCMYPPRTGPSPYNHFIKPLPNHLIRITTGLGFKRGVLRYCYSILSGKDLETGQVTQKRRNEQFKILKKAQSYALDVQHWADFMRVLLSAGFRSEKMITSVNAILFSYVIFLIGKRDFQVQHDVLDSMRNPT